MFDGLADRRVSEEHPFSRTPPPQYASLARLENSMRDQISSAPALVEHAVSHLLGDVGRATESRLDTKVISVIQAVFSSPLAKGFRSAAFHFAVERQYTIVYQSSSV